MEATPPAIMKPHWVLPKTGEEPTKEETGPTTDGSLGGPRPGWSAGHPLSCLSILLVRMTPRAMFALACFYIACLQPHGPVAASLLPAGIMSSIGSNDMRANESLSMIPDLAAGPSADVPRGSDGFGMGDDQFPPQPPSLSFHPFIQADSQLFNDVMDQVAGLLIFSLHPDEIWNATVMVKPGRYGETTERLGAPRSRRAVSAAVRVQAAWSGRVVGARGRGGARGTRPVPARDGARPRGGTSVSARWCGVHRGGVGDVLRGVGGVLLGRLYSEYTHGM